MCKVKHFQLDFDSSFLIKSQLLSGTQVNSSAYKYYISQNKMLNSAKILSIAINILIVIRKLFFFESM